MDDESRGAPQPVSAQAWNARSERRDPNRRTGLVLSGGIAKGVYEAGAAKGLMAQGFEFDVICGTSIGALNGAAIAQGDDTLLDDIWATLGNKPILKLLPQAQRVYDAYRMWKSGAFILTKIVTIPIDLIGAWDGGSIVRLEGVVDPSGARNILSVLDLTRIATPFMCAATNVDTGRAEAFYASPTGEKPGEFDSRGQVPVNVVDRRNPDHVRSYPEIVRASGALPGAFAPVALPGFGFPSPAAASPYRFSDGGVANNTPVRLARKLGVTDMICIFLTTGNEVAPRPSNIIGIVENLYSANQSQLLDDELSLAIDARNSAGRANPNAIGNTHALPISDRVVNIYQVRPTFPIAVTDLGFDNQQALDAGFAQGLADGAKPPAPYIPPASYPSL